MSRVGSRHRAIALPCLTQVETGAIAQLDETLAKAGFDLARVVVASGKGPSLQFARLVEERLTTPRRKPTVVPVGSGTFAAAGQLGEELATARCSVLVAVGGGKTLDVAKQAGARADVDVVCIPTTLANDGFGSPIVSLTDSRGVRQSIGCTMPAAVIVDLDVVKAAPSQMLSAGLADVVSNVTAVLDWRLAVREHGELFDTVAAVTARGAADSVLQLQGLETPQDLRALAEGLLLSGLAMAVAGTSRPCSGSEHLISHALDELLGGHARLHGAQVALGTMIALAAHGCEGRDIRALFRRCGTPVNPADIGLDVTDLVAAVLRAPALRPDRRTVLDEFNDLTSVQTLVTAAFRELRVA